jgi:hypothetical protein
LVFEVTSIPISDAAKPFDDSSALKFNVSDVIRWVEFWESPLKDVPDSIFARPSARTKRHIVLSGAPKLLMRKLVPPNWGRRSLT